MTIQNGARAPRGSACLEKAELAFRDALAQQDILATQHMLWQALRQAT